MITPEQFARALQGVKEEQELTLEAVELIYKFCDEYVDLLRLLDVAQDLLDEHRAFQESEIEDEDLHGPVEIGSYTISNDYVCVTKGSVVMLGEIDHIVWKEGHEPGPPSVMARALLIANNNEFPGLYAPVLPQVGEFYEANKQTNFGDYRASRENRMRFYEERGYFDADEESDLSPDGDEADPQ